MCQGIQDLPGSRPFSEFQKCIGWNQPPHSSALGFILIELIAAMTIILVMATIAVPLARTQILRARELQLHRDLREMREAIDRYKAFSDQGLIPGNTNLDSHGYPPDLKSLVEGVTVRGNATLKYKFLRRVPIDPMTGSTDWGLRSMQDDPDSRGWGGQDVFDVYSKSDGVAIDGTHYEDW